MQWGKEVGGFHFFQSPFFFRLAEASPCFSPLMLLVFDEDEVPVASLLAVKVRERGGLRAWFSERTVVYGGPVFYRETEKEAVLDSLLDEVNRIAGKGTVFTQFRNFHDMREWKDVYGAKNYRLRDRLNLLLDTSDETRVWQGMSGSRRRQIRKSLENGVQIREAAGMNEVDELYDNLRLLYRYKVKKPLPGRDFFRNFYRLIHPSSWGKVFVVTWEGRIIGGIFCPVTPGKTVYELYVCGQDEIYQQQGIYPSVMATWAAIDYAIKNNIPQFDFMGVGIPDKPYGVRDFKMRFGGEIVNNGRFTRINNPFLYQVAEAGYNLLGALNKV